MAKLVIEHGLETLSAAALKLYINSKTVEQGFTALHFCAFKGNVTLATSLLANGADLNAENLMGINVMHAAAQGDQPISLYFFKQKGAELRSRDNSGNTPLHWTCYMTAEVAMVYLISWIKCLDDVDHEGKTPLHMAVK